MRLINTTTGKLEEFSGRYIPPYATLSHTWGDSEVTFQEWSCFSAAPGAGRDKITATCALAAQERLGYAWVDTCCIDKTSSAELTEAINSMYAWYARASTCYVHLADLPPGADLHDALPRCRWFTRGWTLQKLLASQRVTFYDREWTARAGKEDVLALLVAITGIPKGVMCHEIPLAMLPTAQKMSWAERRQTTRVEDTAYCLLGIFGVNMPLLYGEEERAFRRLQEEIIRTTSDLSIFAWRRPRYSTRSGAPLRQDQGGSSGSAPIYSGFLASSPGYFYPCLVTSKMPFGDHDEFSMTNCGIKTHIRIVFYSSGTAIGKQHLFPVHWDRHGQLLLGVRVHKCAGDRYLRADPWELVHVDARADLTLPGPEGQKYLLTDVTSLATTPHQQHLRDLCTRADFVGLRGQVLHSLTEGPHQMVDWWPSARNDPQDNVFFTAGRPWQDSALLLCKVWASDGSGTAEDLVIPGNPSFDIVCFVVGWGSATRPPQVSVVASSGDGAVATREYFNRIKGRDYSSAQLLEHLRFRGIPRAKEARFAVGDGRQVTVSYKLSLVRDQEICERAFWTLTLISEAGLAEESSITVVEEGWILNDN